MANSANEAGRYRPTNPGTPNYDVSTNTFTYPKDPSTPVVPKPDNKQTGTGGPVQGQTDGGGTQTPPPKTVTIPGGTAMGGGGRTEFTYTPSTPSAPAAGVSAELSPVASGQAGGTFVSGGGGQVSPSGPGKKDGASGSSSWLSDLITGVTGGGDGGGTTPSTGPTETTAPTVPTVPTGGPGGGGGGGGSGGGGDGGGGGGKTPSSPTDAELLAQVLKDYGVEVNPYQLPNLDKASVDKLGHVDTSSLEGMLKQIVESQKQQSQNQIDYGVQQGVNELTRAMEDAAKQYQTQRDQVAADEMRALDNQALYAEARGDRGGIGAAQYGSIQAAAAQNRRAVNDAQVKLGTDTARQISDLRSQGEFQKADQLLTITQNYLSQLMGLEQWALQANLGVDEFNAQLAQWEQEYNLNVQQFLTDLDLSAAQLTGAFANGEQTLAYKQQLQESLASSGSALLAAGVLPSKQQLEAMGLTPTQAKAYIKKINAANKK